MNDLVHKKTVIDVAKMLKRREDINNGNKKSDYNKALSDVIKLVRSLTPSEPEVVNCKNCVEFTYVNGFPYGTCYRFNLEFGKDDFCSYGQQIDE